MHIRFTGERIHAIHELAITPDGFVFAWCDYETDDGSLHNDWVHALSLTGNHEVMAWILAEIDRLEEIRHKEYILSEYERLEADEDEGETWGTPS